MSSISTKQNEILSSMGFNGLGNRSPLTQTPSNFGYPDIDGSFPDKSIPLTKLQFSNYDAVVDLSGGGTHLTIQDAINDVNNAGGGSILLKNGTYVLTGDITLYSNIALIGEDKHNTIINCNGANKVDVSGDTPYTTGTIDIYFADDGYVGNGTSWEANVAAGDYIIVNSRPYKIISVNSDTSVTTGVTYFGFTQIAIPYFIGTFKENITIKNLTITGQVTATTSAALDIHGVVNSNFENLIVEENTVGKSIGVRAHYVFNSIFNNLNLDNAGAAGFQGYYGEGNTINNITANNIYGVGITFIYFDNNKISNLSSNNNGYVLE